MILSDIDINRFTGSNTASDDITNQVRHRIFNTDLLYIILLIL